MKSVFLSKGAASLVEIIITTILLAIIVVSCFNYYMNISNFLIRAENYNAATERLAEILEVELYTDYSAKPSNAGWSTSGYSNFPSGTGYKSDCQISPEQKWDNAWSDTTTNGYRNIVATIQWKDGLTILPVWNDPTNKSLSLSMRKTK